MARLAYREYWESEPIYRIEDEIRYLLQLAKQDRAEGFIEVAEEVDRKACLLLDILERRGAFDSVRWLEQERRDMRALNYTG